MNLGIIGGFTEDEFRLTSERGLDSIEFDINENANVPSFIEMTDKINRWIAKYGVEVCAVGQWGTTRILPDGSINKAQMDIEKQLIDAADEVGCHVYITGVNYISSFSFEQNCAFAIAYLSELTAYALPHGVRVCVYNCAYNSFVVCDPAWDIILAAVPELGIKYDPSHAIENGRDYKAEMAKWVERIYHVHAKGTLKLSNDWEFPPAGLDETDWRWISGLLYTFDYEGAISLEPHSFRWQNEKSDRGILYSVKYLRSLQI